MKLQGICFHVCRILSGVFWGLSDKYTFRKSEGGEKQVIWVTLHIRPTERNRAVINMHNTCTCISMRRLTEQRTYEDEHLDGGGEVPVGSLSDEEELLLLQHGPPARRAAVPPPRRARRVQEIEPKVCCCEIGATISHRRSPAPTIHVNHPLLLFLLLFFKKAGEMSATRIGVAFLWGGWRCPKPQNRVVGEGFGGIYKTQLASRDVSEDVRQTQVGNACGCQQRDVLVSDKSGKGIMT